MWGPIEGVRQTKLVLAREALRRGLGKMAPQARVGLALFGHRRGDCSDVEVVRPPEPLDVPHLMGPLEQFNPRGRGPLTLALREAAKSLPRDAGPRTLLLIHDDADNCQPDLCAAAAELQDSGHHGACGRSQREDGRHGQDGVPAAGDGRPPLQCAERRAGRRLRRRGAAAHSLRDGRDRDSPLRRRQRRPSYLRRRSLPAARQPCTCARWRPPIPSRSASRCSGP